jgi:hypothetical protein
LEQQGLALDLRQGVTETVTIVQRRRMTSLVVAAPRFVRNFRVFCRDGLDCESCFGDQKVQFASTRRPVPRFDDDAGFDQSCGGDQSIRIGLQRCGNSLCFRLHAEERDQCRRVDDHDRRLAGQPVFVVPDDVVHGSLVRYGQAGTALRNFEDLFAQARAAGTTDASQTLAQGLHDRCRQGFAGYLRDFASETIGFGILDAECHNGV